MRGPSDLRASGCPTCLSSGDSSKEIVCLDSPPDDGIGMEERTAICSCAWSDPVCSIRQLQQLQ